MKCERCGGETISHIMSMFNTQNCCRSCIDAERAHPLYPFARSVEEEQVKKGNFNFEGIGLPHDLRGNQSRTAGTA